jgi:HD-GYP domain-containing protein (c-di-GMP phosphodiesterase class II)
MVAFVLAQHFPIHVRSHTKLHVGTIPLYLLTVLLPPPLAATAALLGTGIGELMLRKARGGYFSDVASQVGRITVVVFLAALVGHVHLHGALAQAIPLLGAGLVLWAGDIFTAPILLGPISRERPRTIIIGVAREAGPLEAGNVLVGILGAAAVRNQPWTLVILLLPALLLYLIAKRSKEMQENTRFLLESMADAVDLRDPYTGGHSRRVMAYTQAILRVLALSGPEVDLIVAAARVHDIGKIGMPDHVLQKEGPLDDAEWEIMRRHPEQGAALLMRYPDFRRGVDIVRHHHERWDGNGYPDRLQGTDIPLGARIIAVADSYDAMTSDRPYRKGMTAERAAAILREGRGHQWDATLVDAFLASLAEHQAEPMTDTVNVLTKSA